MRLEVSLETIVGLFGISRQSYYQYRTRKRVRDLQEELVVQLVSRIRTIQPRLGGKKLFKIIGPELSGHGIKLGRDLFFDLLGRNGLLIRKRRRQIRTTFSAHGFRIYPNLIRDLEVYFTNQVWVTDITYLKTVSGFVYLHFITDAYSKKIMGYYVADNLETKGSLKALRMAIAESSCSVACDPSFGSWYSILQ
jgi:putative transposase